ncbi:unnamed protein product [Blepharisma stoltei]|uniref:Uncharacterized protein n=1 Tax=Blepharisma stoltei TaxID=1481888 RepID=A0AAU9IUW2_9CILI|nr:unnamed protein product [Blepharisma stoltei]
MKANWVLMFLSLGAMSYEIQSMEAARICYKIIDCFVIDYLYQDNGKFKDLDGLRRQRIKEKLTADLIDSCRDQISTEQMIKAKSLGTEINWRDFEQFTKFDYSRYAEELSLDLSEEQNNLKEAIKALELKEKQKSGKEELRIYSDNLSKRVEL